MNNLLETFYGTKQEKVAIKHAKGHVLITPTPILGAPTNSVGARVRHSGEQGSNTQYIASFFVTRKVFDDQPTLHATRWNKEMHAKVNKAISNF